MTGSWPAATTCGSSTLTQALGTAPTQLLSSESARTFTGTYLGMFAWSAVAECSTPADFDWFEYLPTSAAV